MRYNTPMTDGLSVLSAKPLVDARLTSFLDRYAESAPKLKWLTDIISRLKPFVISGKTVRGSLTVYAYTMFHTEALPSVLSAAAALELFHAGLLIHDDVLDRDTIRRGKDAVWRQYERLGEGQSAADSRRFGDSMAINAGDLCYFLGMSLIDPRDSTLFGLIATELAAVSVAQMSDVSAALLPERLSEDDVRMTYLHKTARYTFSLPLAVGATMAKAPDSAIRKLSDIGQHLGMLYQIRDDELNVTGNPAQTGKPTGTDRTNGKQTLRDLVPADRLRSIREDHAAKAAESITALPVWGDKKAGLTELLGFCMTRNS